MPTGLCLYIKYRYNILSSSSKISSDTWLESHLSRTTLILNMKREMDLGVGGREQISNETSQLLNIRIP